MINIDFQFSEGSESNIGLMDNSSLVIHAAAASDQGSYECQVTTEVDRVSLKHEVNVFNRSRIMEHPAHNTVIKVQCNAKINST